MIFATILPRRVSLTPLSPSFMDGSATRGVIFSVPPWKVLRGKFIFCKKVFIHATHILLWSIIIYLQVTNNGFSRNVSCVHFLPPVKKGAAAPFLTAAKFPSERKKVFNPAIHMYLSYGILTLQISVVLRNLLLCLSYTSSPLMRRGRLRAPSLPVPVPNCCSCYQNAAAFLDI